MSNWTDVHLWLSTEPLSGRRILACLLAAAVIGIERQLQGKPVGIRTSILICLGTYVFVTVGMFVSSESSDPSRIVGQIVTGIGFLGAGVMLARDGNVIGVTSAACIWMLAAIGVTIAVAGGLLGLKLALLTIAVLVGVDYGEASVKWLQRGVHRRIHRSDRHKDSNAADVD